MAKADSVLATQGLMVDAKNPFKTPGLHKFSFLADAGQFLFGGYDYCHADLIRQFKKDEPWWDAGIHPPKLPYFNKPTHIRCIVDNNSKRIIIGFRPYSLDVASDKHRKEYDKSVEFMLKLIRDKSLESVYIIDRITNADLNGSVETMRADILQRRITEKTIYKLDSAFFNMYRINNSMIIPRKQKATTRRCRRP